MAERYTIEVQLSLNPVDESPWSPLLEIPVKDPPKYSTKPLKWLRFVVAAILGAEGDLLDPSNNEQVDHDITEPIARVFRFRANSIFRVVDLAALDHVTSSRWTDESRVGFRSELEARDTQCVIIGTHEEFCKAAHIIPHSKGSQYIEALSRWRNDEDDLILESINDPRNGMLLDGTLDIVYSRGYIGVLKSPNFAMDTNEVLPHVPHPPPLRFTAHAFFPQMPGSFASQDLRFPTRVDDQGWPLDWPPSWLWDFVYGVICAKKYCILPAIDFLNLQAGPKFYPEGVKTAKERTKRDIQQRKIESAARTRAQNAERAARANRRAGNMETHEALSIVYRLWTLMRSSAEGKKQIQKHEAESVEQMKMAADKESQKAKQKVSLWAGSNTTDPDVVNVKHQERVD